MADDCSGSKPDWVRNLDPLDLVEFFVGTDINHLANVITNESMNFSINHNTISDHPNLPYLLFHISTIFISIFFNHISKYRKDIRGGQTPNGGQTLLNYCHHPYIIYLLRPTYKNTIDSQVSSFVLTYLFILFRF